MKEAKQFIIDNRGVKTSVIVSYDEWEKINTDYGKLQKKLEVLLAIQDGMGELKTGKKQSKKTQTLSNFLNESNR
jgi:hypothetical protein